MNYELVDKKDVRSGEKYWIEVLDWCGVGSTQVSKDILCAMEWPGYSYDESSARKCIEFSSDMYSFDVEDPRILRVWHVPEPV